MDILNAVIPLIQSFIGDRQLAYVSKDWYQTLNMNDRMIISTIRNRYPGSWSLQESLERAIENNDVQIFRSLQEFSGYIPVNWGILAIIAENTSISLLISFRVNDRYIQHYLSRYINPVSTIRGGIYLDKVLDIIKKASISEDYLTIRKYAPRYHQARAMNPDMIIPSTIVYGIDQYPSKEMISFLQREEFILLDSQGIHIQESTIEYEDRIIISDDLNGYMKNINTLCSSAYKHLHGKILSHLLQTETEWTLKMLLKNHLYPQYIPDLQKNLRTITDSNAFNLVLQVSKEYQLVDILRYRLSP